VKAEDKRKEQEVEEARRKEEAREKKIREEAAAEALEALKKLQEQQQLVVVNRHPEAKNTFTLDNRDVFLVILALLCFTYIASAAISSRTVQQPPSTAVVQQPWDLDLVTQRIRREERDKYDERLSELQRSKKRSSRKYSYREDEDDDSEDGANEKFNDNRRVPRAPLAPPAAEGWSYTFIVGCVVAVVIPMLFWKKQYHKDMAITQS
jgi:hypothetical protein